MPRASNGVITPIKLLIIGPSKAGKSWYALQAALAGYNLIYLDGDVAGALVAQQTMKIRERVMYFNMRDTYVDGNYVPRFSALIEKMSKSSPYMWNDTKEASYNPDTAAEDDDIWALRLARLTMNDVLIFDSATSLSYSMMRDLSNQAGIDITNVDKTERTVYAEGRNKMTGVLNMIQAAPCHVIMIAHSEDWEQRRKKAGLVKDMGKEENQVIIGNRQVPLSVSKQFGSTMPKFFTDVGWLSVSPTGVREIDFRPTDEREAGGRFTGKASVDEYSFVNLVKAANLPLPPADAPLSTPGLVEMKASEVPALQPASPLKPAEAPPKLNVPGIGGLANINALMAAKQAGK